MYYGCGHSHWFAKGYAECVKVRDLSGTLIKQGLSLVDPKHLEHLGECYSCGALVKPSGAHVHNAWHLTLRNLADKLAYPKQS